MTADGGAAALDCFVASLLAMTRGAGPRGPIRHCERSEAIQGLGFLGLGAQPPTPEWGAMVSSGRQVLLDQWRVATIPGLAIFITSLGFNLLGDGLRDVADARAG